jgi:hypothetical protein
MDHIITNPSMQAAWVFLIDNNGKVKPVNYSKNKSLLAVIKPMSSH